MVKNKQLTIYLYQTKYCPNCGKSKLFRKIEIKTIKEDIFGQVSINECSNCGIRFKLDLNDNFKCELRNKW